ncbi:hypothetical protein XELAEV_18028053mg [Xenopus laevis]|uniref:Uncharacterized protein n=1 Tax=Xenopus laevis TaxID=8355 RepID=A0A974CZ60_XENLA|nr:hypothetical protein XELAEV_18028053mg [Xenopus laevis]
MSFCWRRVQRQPCIYHLSEQVSGLCCFSGARVDATLKLMHRTSISELNGVLSVLMGPTPQPILLLQTLVNKPSCL